ncbi:MAG: metallophosphoesterase, partial [Gammaproteobacteria bacterium]
YSGSDPNNFPFLHIYNQPTAGECGGVPSGTEKYYSFDYGHIHFVCLDANGYGTFTSNNGSNGAMYAWLEEDLSANTNLWLIAFWHHPPYTKGSHDSDWEGELISMRQNYVPLLESYGVDLVLCGHSHCYERSYLIDGHYGFSSSFTSGMMKDGGSGREEESGPYVKPTVGPGANQGAVYVVAGSSGQVSGGALNHPIMHYDALRLGSLVLDIEGTALRAKFLRESGAVDDYFTIYKGSGPPRFGKVVATLAGNGTINLAWVSRSDRYYQVERSVELSTAAWTIVALSLPGTGGTMNWSTSVNGTEAKAFYRVFEYVD